MSKDRDAICNIISEMLDNPDEYGIYPTTKAYDQLEVLITMTRIQAIGWAHADACTHMDKGEDYRNVDVPSIIERAEADLK